jgi:hypothetical protein
MPKGWVICTSVGEVKVRKKTTSKKENPRNGQHPKIELWSMQI